MELIPTSLLPIVSPTCLYPYLWGGWGDDCCDDRRGCDGENDIEKKIVKKTSNANNNVSISNSVIVVSNIEADISGKVLLDLLIKNNISTGTVIQLLLDARLITAPQVTEATNRVAAPVSVLDLLKNLKVHAS